VSPLLAVVYAAGWVLIFVFRVESRRESLPFYGRAERLAVNLAPLVLSLHATAACVLFANEPPPSGAALTAAGALYLGAMGFWFWGRRMIGPLRLRRLPQQPPLEFRRDGAFRLVRHPLYSSYIALALVPLIARPTPLLFTTFAAAFAAIAVRAVQEEGRLRQQLGSAYDDYSRRVRRLIPFVW
jgi:protein-S-isoprenylcysteine O-methyltransferase Ste14